MIFYAKFFIFHPLCSIFNRRKAVFLGLLMCLIASFQLKAQVLNVNWTLGYPALSNPYIGILCENDSLKLRFTINTDNSSGEAAKTRLVRLVLPAGVTVESAADADNVSGSITTGTVKQSGTTWDIPINTISYNSEVNLVVVLKAADCSSPTGSFSATVSILSAGTVLDGSSRSIALNVVKPNITATPQVANPVLSKQNDSFTYNIPLSVSNNVSAKSMRITITKDQFTTLSEFKLGSRNISPASSNANTVVLYLTEAIVGAPISAARQQILRFTAKASVGGSRPISATYTYPQSGTACDSNKSLFNLTLSYPLIPGVAVIRNGSARWVYNHPVTGAAVYKAYDGRTTNWIQQTITNTGNAPIGRFTIDTRTSMLSCINDTATFYYQIGNSAIKAVPRAYNYSWPLESYYDNHNNDMLTKPALVGKPMRVTYTVEEEVSAGTVVNLWIPILVGTYDNTRWGTPPNGINATYNLVYKNQRLARYINGTSIAYDLNGNLVKTVNTFEGGYEWSPVFISALGKEQIKPGMEKRVNVPIYSNTVNPSDGYSSTLHIQLPKWMELYNDGSNLSNSVQLRGRNLAVGNTISHNRTTNTYSLTVQTSFADDISIRYKGKPNTFGYKGNQTDTIRYWIDWDPGYGLAAGSAARAASPVIAYHAKNIQQIEYLVNPDGIALNSFALERISRGLKVRTGSASNLRTPDDGSLADFSVIDNEMYLQGDTGRIVVKGQTLGNPYEYLYVLVNSDYRSYFNFAGLSQTNPDTRATVYIDNGKSPVTIANATIVENGENCYLKFRNTGKFPANTNVKITVPFVAGNTKTGNKSPVKIEVYLSNVNIDTPLNPQPADRHGMEFVSGKFGVHNKTGGLGQSYNTAPASVNNGTTTISLGLIRTVSNNDGYEYPNEYRPYMHPTTMTINIPAGYTAGNFKIAKHASYLDASSLIKADHSIPPQSSTVHSDGSITYIYNVASIYDFTANTYTKAQAAGRAGKWIAPDDFVFYHVYVDLTPTPQAPSLGTVQSTLKYKMLPDYKEEISQNTVKTSVSYNGARGELTVPTGITTVFDYRVTVPSVIASIVSSAGSGSRASWLYAEGNIRDVSLQTGSKNISATPVAGNQGHWIPLGNLTMGTPVSYQLTYTHNSMKVQGDSMRVYLVADFTGANWNPNMSVPVDVKDTKHLGESEWIITKPSTNSAIQGAITVPSAKISYGTPYNVMLRVDSRAGEADLINPEITLTVPSDQIPGTFQYEYPGGSGQWKNIPAAAISRSGNQITLKSINFESAGNFILYGNRVNTSESASILNIRMPFSPGCNTILDGFSYTASFAGRNLINNAVSSINDLISGTVTANVQSNYYFSTVTDLTAGVSFGGNNKNNVLQVTVNKWTGELYDIFDTDSLVIILPKWLNINGVITTKSDLLFGLNNQPVASKDIVNKEGSGDQRRISIKLPTNVLNSDAQKAKNKPFTYHIPIIYTEDAQDAALRDHPEHTIRTDIYTVVQFAPVDECAQGTSFSLGNASKNIALLTLKSDNPYIYNIVSLGKTFKIQATSAGFGGGWYADESLSDATLLSSGAAYTHPSRTGADTVRVFVKSRFNARDYGKISVTLRTPPIDLSWRTTATDENWLNPANWTTNLGATEDRKAYLPAPVSKVTLPSGANKYPVLTDTAACHIVRFEHGAELGRQDFLHYDSARVQLNVGANQWYMFSPPLRDMYSGDFYRNNPDPQADRQTAYTMLFNAKNPETSVTKNSEWTGAFNTPHVLLKPGSGLAFWINKHDAPSYAQHPAVSFDFPKCDKNHHTYNPNRFPPGNITGTYQTDRPHNGRFIYEGSGSTNGSVTLQDVHGKTNGEILVGNPFMAHLNFDSFYADNAAALNSFNGYKLASGVGVNGLIKSFYSYKKEGGVYVSTDPAGSISGLIPPMQSFVINVKSGKTVTANIRSHTNVSVAPADAFRNTDLEEPAPSSLLNILATCNSEISKTIILQHDAYTTAYVPSEDSYKLFVSRMLNSTDVLEPIQVYTRSSDGYALDINCIGTSEQDITIPLCIRTSKKGEITLNFSGMDSFSEGTAIYLHDTQHHGLIDLSQQSEYVFNKTDDELYLEERLSLVIGKNTLMRPLGVEAVSDLSAVRILSLSPHKLRIVSVSGETLGNVRITDAWGRMVLDNPSVSSSTYEYQTPTPGVYVVRVGAEVKKVVSIR
jgi:hypothetical protein